MPWARPRWGFTGAFEAVALVLGRELPVRQAARLLRCSDKQRWRRIEFYGNQARALETFAGVQSVGLDVTNLLRRGHNYITVVLDVDAKRLLFATEGREHHTVVDFAVDLKAHGGDPAEVRYVCMDMSAPSAKGAVLALRQPQISYDRFHVIVMANEARDLLRRAEMRDEAPAVRGALGDSDRKTLKWLMWGKRRNPSGWSQPQINAMHWLQHSKLKSAQAWRLKIAL